MSTTTASIRIRPIRFGFLLDPEDATALRQVLQTNTCLWGGMYNYLLPVPRKTPQRYRDFTYADGGTAPLSKLKLMKGTGPSAQEFIDGLLDAFEPDLLVETKPGLAQRAKFDKSRILTLDQFNEEQNGQRKYGIDLRAICRDLYDEVFRFVQRHPPKVIEPRPMSKRYGPLFAAAFGEFPSTGTLAQCRNDFENVLDAKEEKIDPAAFHELYGRATLFPLRVGAYKLAPHRRGWTPNPMLFYMDETKIYDIVEYWNYRALGWRVQPLPRLLAPKLTAYCENFIKEAHRPYPPPSNGSEDANFLCSRSCAFDEMQAFVATLNRPETHQVSIDPRVPRLWEEWGRRADHADVQLIEYETKLVDVSSFGGSISVGTVAPDFARESRFATHTCTNVIESLPGGAPVVPWQMIDMTFLAGQLRDREVWVGREGICIFSGAYTTRHHLRVPSSLNVFAAWAQKNKSEIELSAAGRTAEQLINALGGLIGVRLVGNEELIRVLDRIANGTLEVEVRQQDQSGFQRRRLKKSSIPLKQIQQLLRRIYNNNVFLSDSHLSALLDSNILTLGIEVPCAHCDHATWYSLEQVGTKLKCERCLREFDFPLTAPRKTVWSYRVQGPFAVENYASGSYCVAASLAFLEDRVARGGCTWVPSFKLRSKDGTQPEAEADLGAFVNPGQFSNLASPLVLFGECKTFGDFESRDYERMRSLARMFPGAVICFCTLKNELTSREKKRIAVLARQGRVSLRTGQRKNPVLVLTRTELLGQFKFDSFTKDYPSPFPAQAEGIFLRADLQDICDFTQQVHLGMNSYYEWLQARRQTKIKRAGPTQPTTAPP